MHVALVEHDRMADYRFSHAHPLRPERFTLAIDLMRAWGLVSAGRAEVLTPAAATIEDLALVHDADYIEAVRHAAELTPLEAGRYGLGPGGDTPVFTGMHDAAALAVGGTLRAMGAVLGGEVTRAHNPAGGLHHAHRDHASGFCIYNDAAVAIEWATRQWPGARIAYVDVDAHHGDGVEAALAERADVLTLSVHESGGYLFPGTGRTSDIGHGAGLGYAVNVPLLPASGPESYELVSDRVIRPALERFEPDVVVAQLGADSHRNDPLTHLHAPVSSFDRVVRDLVSVTDAVCGGRIVALGGGGYDTYSAVPRMWACVMCRLLGEDVPEVLPASWVESAGNAAREGHRTWHEPESTFAEHIADQTADVTQELLRETDGVIRLLERTHPLFA